MGASYESSVNRSDTTRALESTYDAQRRMADFLGALNTRQDAIGNQNTVFSNALNTMNTLGQQAQGAGPNPAAAQLALNTGQNIQNQAALLAGQRGVGANPGLAARQIGQLGGGIQQESVGQAAVLRANQQLAAQQQLQQQQALLAALANQQIAQQQGGQAALGQFNLNQAGLFTGAADAAAKFNAENSFGNKLGNILGGLVGAGGQIAASAFRPAAAVKTAGGAAGAVSAGNPKMNPMSPIPYSSGGKVSGKAKVKGDSQKNDTVPAMLSPGEVVIPRTVVKDPKKVAAFIKDTLGFNLKVGGSKKS